MPDFSIQDALKEAYLHIGQGRFAEAEQVLHTILRVKPHLSTALLALGHVLEMTGRHGEATKAYDAVSLKLPGNGSAFSRRSVILLRSHWGMPSQPRVPNRKPSLTCTALGSAGRFGNQLFQYAVTRLYAQAHALEAAFPDWLGRDLFDLNDPLISEQLPPLSEQEADILGALSGRAPRDLNGHDLSGYFLGHSADFAPWKNEFRALFQPGQKAAAAVKGWQETLQQRAPGTRVALHLRRGDFGTGPYWIAPEAWYLTWLAAIWPSLDRPTLYIATDDPAVLQAFAMYNPLSARDFGAPLPGAEFFCDFHMLTQAHALAISNSSFSFVAAMLNTHATRWVRPEKEGQRLIPFDPWNADIILRDPA